MRTPPNRRSSPSPPLEHHGLGKDATSPGGGHTCMRERTSVPFQSPDQLVDGRHRLVEASCLSSGHTATAARLSANETQFFSTHSTTGTHTASPKPSSALL